MKPGGHAGNNSVCVASNPPTGKGLHVSDSVSDSTVQDSKFEIVNLKQFVRGGKLKQYLNFGVITLNSVENDY